MGVWLGNLFALILVLDLISDLQVRAHNPSLLVLHQLLVVIQL